MSFIKRKITVLRIGKPKQFNLNEELQWLGNSLGLFGERDKDRSCFRIFITLLKAAKADNNLSSDAIAIQLNLSRGTVIHHINKLMDSGMVIQRKSKYILRERKLELLLEDLYGDIKKAIEQMKETAREIDEVLGF